MNPAAQFSELPDSNGPAILVASCDKYSDLWPLFFELWRKYWPNCPYQVYLLTNHRQAGQPGVTSVLVGDDSSWSGNLRRALEAIPESSVLLLVDDLFLVAPVETDAVAARVAEWRAAGGNCLKLNPTVPGDVRFSEHLDVASAGAPYRASTVLTLWRKDLLNELLQEGETAWDFEIRGSHRSDLHDRFFVTRRAHFPVVNGVIKGRWSRKALARVNEAAGHPVFPTRPVLSPARELLYQAALLRSKLLYWLPPGWGRRLLDGLRSLRDRSRSSAPVAPKQ